MKKSTTSKAGRAQDRRNVSSERHEIDYVVARLEKEFRPIIKEAVKSAKSNLGHETSRNKVLVEARGILLSQTVTKAKRK
jgi:hypothetical protein